MLRRILVSGLFSLWLTGCAVPLNLPQSAPIATPADVPSEQPVELPTPTATPAEEATAQLVELPTPTVAPTEAPTTAPTELPVEESNEQPDAVPTESGLVQEQPVTVLPLTGPLADFRSEVSGMAWHGDNLVFLPQFPRRTANQLFYLPKQAILDFLTGANPNPLNPIPIPVVGRDAAAQLEGFDGFEAIAFAGDQLYLTAEAALDGTMKGYLITGSVTPNLSELRMQSEPVAEMPAQSPIPQMSYEAVLLTPDSVLAFYEANGFLLNPRPRAYAFEPATLAANGEYSLPNLEYRITDATPLDTNNRFWVINYFYPGDIGLGFGQDALTQQYGIGQTHAASNAVERLVELQYDPTGITLVERPPLQLQLGAEARNWEGIVRLETPEANGFLLITDRNPATIFAFVPLDAP